MIVEAITLWLAVALFSISAAGYLVGLFFDKSRWQRISTYFVYAGFVFQMIAIGSRWVISGHPPVYSVYEHALTNSFAVVLIFLVASRKYEKISSFGFGAMIVALVMLGHGIMNGTEQEALSVQYKSNWLWVHVGFGQLAYGAYVLSALLALAYILKNRMTIKNKSNKIYDKLPALGNMDDLILKFVAIGFVGETGMIATGSIWASSLWGSYWSWEPLQIWSLISWLIYGVFLHLRLTLGWKGSRGARLSLLCFSSVMFIFWGISLVSDVHTRIL